MDATKLKDELITCKCGLCNNYFRVPRGALIGPFCKINQKPHSQLVAEKKAQIAINAANRRFREEDEGTAIDNILGGNER